MAPPHIEGVPAHMGNLQPGIARLDRRDVARNPVQAINHLVFEAARGHELCADTYAQEWTAALAHRLLHRLNHAGNAVKPTATVGKCANARQNDMIGGEHILRPRGDLHLAAQAGLASRALERLLRRVQIAGAIVDDGDDAHSILKRALGRWDALGLTGIDRNRAAKRASNPLETRFGDVMAVRTIKGFDVQRDPGVAGEGLEELAHKLSVKSADLLGRKLGPEGKERPARHVERNPSQRLVHRQQAIGVARQTSLVAERLRQRLAERDAHILDRVVIVDMAGALGPNLDIDKGMTRELIEHMIEETNAGCNIGKARPIEVEADLDARLLRLAYDCALAHGDFEALSWFARGVIARRAALGHLSFGDTRADSRSREFRDATRFG